MPVGHWRVVQLPQHVGKALAIVFVAIVAVGRGDDMRDAVSVRDAAHFRRHLPGLRAIIDSGKDVSMNVDHGKQFRSSLQFRLSRTRVVSCE